VKRFRGLFLAGLIALVAGLGLPGATVVGQDSGQGSGPNHSVWLIESCRIRDVPSGSFMPDRAFIPGSTDPKHNQVFVQLPVNVGVIKQGDHVTLFDAGMTQDSGLISLINCHPNARLPQQLAVLGIRPEQVDKIVLGHAHWDHAGQLSAFPNATVYVQREEVRGIEWALNYPEQHISAVDTSPGGCKRSPACGYPPQTVAELMGKVTGGKAVLLGGEAAIGPGMTAIPAFRGHTAGSQLLQVSTARGPLLFGSDTYSSWQGLRDWEVANVQQTDTVQQFLAYEKCHKLAGLSNCVSAHEPTSYSDAYPLTKNWWCGPNGTRGAELTLAQGEESVVARAKGQFPQNCSATTG
jgi:glyoxylase-like metal-dependent hydrolase (beta-lactamase superfamily II)